MSELKLSIGDKIKIGKNYSKDTTFKEGEIIELIEGYFDEDNGLYSYESTAPSIYNKDDKDYDSIFHLFGNDLENFMDCEVVK